MTTQSNILEHGAGETIQVMGATMRFLCQAAEAWSLMHVTAPQRVGPPPHEHDFEEAYYILSGAVRLTVDGVESVLGAGDFVRIPGGRVHGFRGESAEPAQMLVFQTPADAGDFFREVAREVTRIPQDLQRIPEIGARHGVRFPPADCHAPRP